ncbi:hypothetical protein ACLMAB_21450 [Brevibacillus laterosporus]
MNIVEREMNKKFQEGVESVKKSIRQELIQSIRDGESEKVIQKLIRCAKFNDKEVEEIYIIARVEKDTE